MNLPLHNKTKLAKRQHNYVMAEPPPTPPPGFHLTTRKPTDWGELARKFLADEFASANGHRVRRVGTVLFDSQTRKVIPHVDLTALVWRWLDSRVLRVAKANNSNERLAPFAPTATAVSHVIFAIRSLAPQVSEKTFSEWVWNNP